MNGTVKKYLPYAIIIFAIYLIVPLFFMGEMQRFYAIPYYFIFLLTQVGCAAVFSRKHGLDFLFALIAPIAFLPSMFIYNGGFANPTNIILLIVYLVAGIFGLFLGDLVFGDERHKKEKQDQKKAEEVLLRAKRRDERENRRMSRESSQPQRERRQRPSANESSREETYSAAEKSYEDDVDDFDYDKYMSDIDKLIEDDRY